MTVIESRVLPSRRTLSVLPTPWAALNQPTAEGYPAWKSGDIFYTGKLERTHIRELELDSYPSAVTDEPLSALISTGYNYSSGLDRKLQTVELNEYPSTPQGYYRGYYPGSEIAQGFRKGSNYTLVTTLELNEYPSTPISAPTSATDLKGFNYSRGLKRKLQTVELNEYPSTPSGYYSGYYPGSKLAEGFRTEFNRTVQTVELNEYPQTPLSPAIITAVIPQDIYFRARVSYNAKEPLFTPAYFTQAGTTPTITFGLSSTITDTKGITSTITDTQGLESNITDTMGLSSEID